MSERFTVVKKVNQAVPESPSNTPRFTVVKKATDNPQQSANNFLFSQLPTGDVRKDIKNHQELMQSKTTIPSVDYDENYILLSEYNSKISKDKSEQQKENSQKIKNQVLSGMMSGDTAVGVAAQNFFNARNYAKEDISQYEINGNWTPEAKTVLTKLYKKDEKEARKFAKSVNNAITNNEYKEFAKNNEVLASAASVPINFVGGIDYIFNLLEYAGGKAGGKDIELEKSSITDMSNSLRQGVTEEIDSKIGKFLYSTGMSLADMAFASLAGGTGGFGASVTEKLGGKFGAKIIGKILSSIGSGTVMGLEAASATTNDVLDRGGTDAQAIASGAMAGAFETIFEAFSLGELKAMGGTTTKLFKELLEKSGKDNIKVLLQRLAIDSLKSAGVNATEEMSTELANILYDTLANKDISNYAIMVENYMNENPKLSVEKAKSKARNDFILQILESGASGALMGLILGGGETADSYIVANNEIAHKNDKNQEFISLEEFSNRSGEIWRNVDYSDNDTKSAIMSETHNRMVAEGKIIKVSEETQEMVGESFPDLRSMKKKERTPILKEAMDTLKNNLRQFLNGFKNQNFEFEINGKVLEAKLYNTGINEVLEKITQEKANMLYSTDEIFKNSCYLYSTSDYDGDPNVYRWNYFYTPVQIGEETVGVRIAVRDVATPSESQIYNWGIKKDTSLDGMGRGNNRISHDVSSNVSNNNIPQGENVVNNNISTGAENNSSFTEYSAKSPEFDAVKDTIFEAHGVQRLTAEQQKIFELGRRIGYKVIFENEQSNNGITKNGRIDKTNKIIYINTAAQKPVQFIIKHELTHFLEINKAKYFNFANEIMESELFERYVLSQGYNSKSEYNAAIVEVYSKFDKKFGEHEANLEMVANFIGDNLFGGESNIDQFIQSLDAKQRNKFIQFVLDFINHLKESLSGNKDFDSDLVKLENKYIQLLKETQEIVNNDSGSLESNNTQENNQYSFVRTRSKKRIEKAEQMERDGKSRDEIWQKVRIIRDTRGNWVREINDRDMYFDKKGHAAIWSDPRYDEFAELEEKNNRTEEENNRYLELKKEFEKKYLYGRQIVGNYFKHDKLFKEYPQLYFLGIEFKNMEGKDGYYDSAGFKIVINEDLKNEILSLIPAETIIHELQHAIQDLEGRPNGASIKYWNMRMSRGDTPLGKDGKPLTATQAYYNTAGEIEANLNIQREFMSDYKRKKHTPDFGWDRAVFTDEKYTVPQSVSKDAVSSMPDNANYLSAIESGDIKTAQRMVDEAAKDNGYTERLYHQTGADFTEFNTDNQKAGKYDWELPTGTFLKPTSEDIGLEGKKQMELYAKLQKPLTFKNRQEAQDFWKKNVDRYAETVSDIQKLNADYSARYNRAEMDVQQYLRQWKEENPTASRREIYDDLQFRMLYDKAQDVKEAWEDAEDSASIKAKELIDGFISQNDYDGIIVEKDQDGENRSTKSYIVFNSNQLKDASAVTYDDNGEVIPLSDRFDSEQADIRHSLSLASSPEILLERYENGEITRQEYLDMLKKEKPLNPVEIANLKEEDANTTPPLKKFKGENIGDKESNTYQSLLDSDIFDDRFKAEIEDDTWIKNYKSITNKETLKKAARELDAGGAAYVKHWDNKDPEHASLIDIAVGFILIDRYQRVGDYESAAAAAERVRMFGTASGQQVQIFSILGRLNPNTMVAYAQKELSKALETFADTKTKKWLDKNADKFKLTEDDIFYIRRLTLQATMFDDNTRPKAVALAKICARIQDKMPSEAGEAIRALQRFAMLLNPKTILRNIGGNAGMIPTFIASDFFGSIIDKKISQKTGVRTTGNFKLKGSGTALKKGLYESWDDFKQGIRTRQEDLNRFEVNVKGGKHFNEHHNGKMAKQLNAIAKTLNKIDNFTSFCLEAGDRPFFEMWMTNSLNNQLRLNNVDIPTPEMLEIAKQEALQRTWQDDNKFTRSVSKIKNVLNEMVHIPGTTYGLGDWALKFVKTPSNIAKAIIDFSPVGFDSAISNARKLKIAIDKGKFTPQLQKEYVRSLSNAITGTLMYTLVALGASLGLVKLSGDKEEDKDASNYEQYIMGIPPYSIEFLGVNITYDWAQPFGSILATVADFMESREANPEGDTFNAIHEAIKAGGKAFTKQSFLQSLYDVFSSEDIVEALSTALLAEPAAFIPQRWSQTASFFDEYRRTSYDATSGFTSAINKAIAKIPGLRTTLPKQVNILGEDVKNTQYLNPWEAFASPWNTYPKSSSEVVGEIYDLYKSTGDNSVIPRTAPNYFTVKGNKVILTPDEKADFQRSIGKKSAKLLGKLFDNNYYSKLSDKEKVAVVGKIYQFAYAKTKSEREYDYETLSAMVGEYKSGKPMLTKDEYKNLPKKAREMLAQEYFLSKAEMCRMDNYDELIEYYIKQARE